MQLKFDSNQEFQIDAIRAVMDLFEGLPLEGDDFSISVAKQKGTGLFATQSEDVLAYGNHAMLPDDALLSNLQLTSLYCHAALIRSWPLSIQVLAFYIIYF